MELQEVFNQRYSARKYAEKEVEEEKLEQVLDAGRIVPTACNLQPQRMYVIKSKEAIQTLDSVTKMRYGAPTVILICSDMENCWNSRYEEGYNTSEMDCSIATTYMMLKATELGLGTVWVRAFNADEVKKAFDLPENIKPICMLTIGYKADDCEPNATSHFTRNELKDEVEYL